MIGVEPSPSHRHSYGSRPFHRCVQACRVAFELVRDCSSRGQLRGRASRDLPEGASLELQVSVKAYSRLLCTARLPRIAYANTISALAREFRRIDVSDVELIAKNDQLDNPIAMRCEVEG